MKKAILILLMFSACQLTPYQTETEGKMIPKYLSMLPYRKNDVITNELKNRLFKVNNIYDGVEKTYADYIADGYTIFDAPASGDIDLSSQTPGKYLVVWKTNDPSGTLNVSVSKTITGSGSVLHTDVVIMGVKLNSSNQITDHTINIDVSFGSSQNFQGLLTFIYCDIDYQGGTSSSPDDFYILNSELNITSTETLQDCFLENSGVYLTGSGVTVSLDYTDDYELNNVYFSVKVGGTALTVNLDTTVASKTIGLKNIYVDNLIALGLDNSNSPTYNIQNLVMSGESVLYPRTNLNYGSNKNIVYITEEGSVSSLGSIAGLIIKTINVKEPNYIGVPDLDSTAITWTDFKTLNADLNIEYRQDNSLYGNQRRNFYTASFQPDRIIYDELKKFDRNHYFVVHRTDIEDELIPSGTGKDIENLIIYDHGTSDEYDFSFDENFLILAEDASSNEVVLCWYDGALYQTVLSDFWDNTTYDIKKCFQLWDIESMNGLTETIRKYDENTAIADSPMKGEIVFDNMDNEIVLR